MVSKQMTEQRKIEREESIEKWRERRKTMLKALPVGGLGGVMVFLIQIMFP